MTAPRRKGSPRSPWPLVALLALVVLALWWLGRTGRAPAPREPAASAPRPGATAREGPAATPGRAAHESAARRAAQSAAPAQGGTSAPPERARPQTTWQPHRPLLPSGPGQVAIIVDDVGYDQALVRAFTALPYALTFSILPQVAGSEQLARRCAGAGREVMLHLPMEPNDSRLNPGPGCITVAMSDSDIAALVEQNLASVPGAVGANNHMGSRATAQRGVMRAVLATLRGRGLFFVDSLTTGSSVAREVASELGVPYAERSVFLDTNFDPEPQSAEDFFRAAQERVQQLGRIAQRRGGAIGICHYRPQTAEMLARILPALEESGVEVVPISRVVLGSAARTPGAAPQRESPRYEPTRGR